MKQTLLLLLFFYNSIAISSESYSKCNAFLKASKENYKVAHKEKSCLISADKGDSRAQYTVGMSYGFAQRHDLEEKYYRLSANQNNIAAYLGLGHLLSEQKPWEAIYWYQRYYSTKSQGYGYAAQRISKVFKDMNKPTQQKYWYEKCKQSDYKRCT